MFYLVYTDNLGGRMARPIKGNLKKATYLFKNVAKRTRETALYRDTSGFHSTTQLEYLVLWHSPEGNCYWGRSMKCEEREDVRSKIEKRRYVVPI